MSNSRHALVALLLVALVALAGCSGGGGTAPEPTTDQQTAAGSANATEIKRAATAAMADVRTYRLDANIATVVSSNNLQRRTVTNSTGVVNRSADELRMNRTVTVAGRSNSVTTYVVNETLYQRSPRYTTAYSSKWVKRTISENFAQRWSALDTLTRQRELLNVSDVELVGEETVDGTETYVLQARPDPAQYEDLSTNVTRQQVDSVRNISVTYWLATDTYRPVESDATINSTATLRGREVSLHQELTIRFSGYGDDASIRLPAAAETAVSPADPTNATRTTTA